MVLDWNLFCRFSSIEPQTMGCLLFSLLSSRSWYSWQGNEIFFVNNCPKRYDYVQLYYISTNRSTYFGWYPHPSSGARSNCNYNIWRWSNRICYRPLTWRSRNFSSDSSISTNRSTYFGWYPHPSSGARSNCNYIIWHRSNRICYRSLTWRSQNCSFDSSTSAEGSKYDSTSARCCNYSLNVLLMMDKGIIRNM